MTQLNEIGANLGFGSCQDPHNHYENLSILIIFQSKMEMPPSLSDESVNFCLLVPTNKENICKRITFFNKIPSYEINQR